MTIETAGQFRLAGMAFEQVPGIEHGRIVDRLDGLGSYWVIAAPGHDVQKPVHRAGKPI